MISALKMKIVLFGVPLCVGCALLEDHASKIQNFVDAGKCSNADQYALQNLTGDYMRWQLGNIALKCWGSRMSAIEHYKAGAALKSQYSYLSVNALEQLGEKSPVAKSDIELTTCIAQANKQEAICSLSAYGGVSSIGSPVIRQRQQICVDQRMSAEEHCFRLHKPDHLKGLPARNPVKIINQSQQIIIQRESNPNACIQDGGPIYCPNYRR